MKTTLIGFFAALCLATAAHADTLTELQRPLPPPARFVCAATGFSSATTIAGKCQQSIPSTGKYVQPARYIYDVVWSLAGVLQSAAVTCVSPAHLGADHSGCPQMVTYSDTHTAVVVDGVPYWLAGVSILGAEALNTQTDAWVWAP